MLTSEKNTTAIALLEEAVIRLLKEKEALVQERTKRYGLSRKLTFVKLKFSIILS